MNTNHNTQNIIDAAKKKNAIIKKSRDSKYFLDSLAWLSYLGLIRTNICKPSKTNITLKMLVNAGKYEPRIYELLPAIVYRMPFIFNLTKEKLPTDLKEILNNIDLESKLPDFRGIKAKNYLKWLHSPSIEIAINRLKNPPRYKTGKNQINEIGKKIKEKRIQLGYTQTNLSKKFKISLRAIRDIEQNYENTSLKRLNEILNALDLKLNVLEI